MTEQPHPCPICGSTGRCEDWCEAQQEDARLEFHQYGCDSSGTDCEVGCNCYGCRYYTPRRSVYDY